MLGEGEVMNSLKKFRANRTQKEIADLAGITTSHYGFIENGERQPSLKVAKKIADIYNRKIEEIFFVNTPNITLDTKRNDEAG
jgi:putative transcriptional regulator